MADVSAILAKGKKQATTTPAVADILAKGRKPAAPAPEPTMGQKLFGGVKAVGNALISSEKKFGASIGDALFAGTAQKQIAEEQARNTDMQTRYIKRIREKKAKGEDVTKLMETFKKIGGDVTQLADIVPSVNKSTKQILGEGAGVALDILGTGSLAGSAKNIVTKPTTIIGGALRGAGEGALSGGIFGAGQGAARAAQEDKSLKEIGEDAVVGGVAGGALGGILGGVSGGIAGGVRGAKLKREKFAQDLVMPKETPKVKEAALNEGRLKDATIFGKAEITPSKRDVDLKDAVKDIVSPKKTLKGNIDALKGKVGEINKGVGTYIKENKVPFNTNQLRSRLNAAKEESKLIFASDTTAENTYNAVVDEFMKHVEKKDTAGLFKARQSFDKIPAIKKLLDSEGLGENVKKQIVLDVRKAANEYVASLLPKGNTYKADLLRETRILEALGNVAEKNTGVIGKNKLQSLVAEYPILKWIVGGIATGITGAAGIGVGSVILGSSD